MCRVKIGFDLKIDQFDVLKDYLEYTIGNVFRKEIRILSKVPDKNFMKVELDLDSGYSAYNLGIIEGSFPIEKYIQKFN